MIKIDWSLVPHQTDIQHTKYSLPIPALKELLELWFWDFQDAMLEFSHADWSPSDLELEGRSGAIRLSVRWAIGVWCVHVSLNIMNGQPGKHFVFMGDIMGDTCEWRSLLDTWPQFSHRGNMIDLIHDFILQEI